MLLYLNAGGTAMIQHILAAAAVLAASASLGAQSATVRQETQIRVKEGRDVRVTGCVTRSASGRSFMLADVEGPEGRTEDLARTYVLVGDDNDDLRDHVGKLVEIRGKAADAGDEGRVEFETRTELEREDADDRERTTRTAVEGDLSGIPYLGVESVRVIRSTCD
jgi:uncharacterized protein (DUF58 family)